MVSAATAMSCQAAATVTVTGCTHSAHAVQILSPCLCSRKSLNHTTFLYAHAFALPPCSSGLCPLPLQVGKIINTLRLPTGYLAIHLRAFENKCGELARQHARARALHGLGAHSMESHVLPMCNMEAQYYRRYCQSLTPPPPSAPILSTPPIRPCVSPKDIMTGIAVHH